MWPRLKVGSARTSDELLVVVEAAQQDHLRPSAAGARLQHGGDASRNVCGVRRLQKRRAGRCCTRQGDAPSRPKCHDSEFCADRAPLPGRRSCSRRPADMGIKATLLLVSVAGQEWLRRHARPASDRQVLSQAIGRSRRTQRIQHTWKAGAQDSAQRGGCRSDVEVRWHKRPRRFATRLGARRLPFDVIGDGCYARKLYLELRGPARAQVSWAAKRVVLVARAWVADAGYCEEMCGGQVSEA